MGLFTHKLERVSRTIFEKYTKQLTDLIDKKHGVYALYDEDELYYVGKAIDLKRRVGQHLKDRHLALWTHFSLFLTTKSTYIDEIESILITLASPKGNRVRPKGNVDNKLKSTLEKLIREQQKLELGYILGEKKSNTRRISKSSARPKLEGLFSKSRPLSRTYKGKDYTARLLKNGNVYFRVYVHVRSPTDRTKRSQKYAYRLKTITEARREEKKLLQEAAREV